MDYTGTIIEVSPLRSGISKTSGSEWHVQEYVIEEDDKFHRKMLFEVFGLDKINELDIHRGERLKVYYDFDATNYNGKWYNKIKVFKVERLDDEPEYTTNEPF